jgi:chromosome transmission fidelity protein 4
MFAGIVEAGKLERALDLVERLHLEKSYDLAMTIADSHRKLVDRIEDAKDRRFGGMSPEYGCGQTGAEDDYDDGQDYSSRITPDSTLGRKRSMQDESKGVTRMIRRKQGLA